MDNIGTTFRGIWPALITPFRNGEVDHDALRRLVLRFREAGVAGLVVCGTTGEPHELVPARAIFHALRPAMELEAEVRRLDEFSA